MDLTGCKFGKYELVTHLGQGGMAEVYKAHQPGLDRFVAIKVMHRHLSNSPDFISRFKREAKSIGQLQHTHIMHVIDFDVEDDIYYMVMDYIRGSTLSEYLEQKGDLPVNEALDIMAQLVTAVDYAHQQGMIHRDIKPANVMFLDNTNSHVILTDFGMARLLDDVGLTMTGALIGTPTYMSPEATRGEQADERADIYSLGVMLYEMVTGTPPYTGDTALSIILKHNAEPLPPPRKVKPDLPESVEQLLLKALTKDRADRFQNAAEFKEAILQTQLSLTNNQTVNVAAYDQTIISAPPPPKPKPWMSIAGGAILVVILLAVLSLTLNRQSDEKTTDPVDIANTTASLTETPTLAPVIETGDPPLGILRFTDNDTVRAGNFILQMDGVSVPADGSHYELWLTDDDNEKTLNLVSQLIINNGRVNFESSTEQNLLGTYSQVIIGLEPDDDQNVDISNEVAFVGSLSAEFLTHIRQVTFEAPANSKGFLPGAQEQLRTAISHAGFAQESLAANNINDARRHAEHVVNILEGKEGTHFGDLDGDGLAQNPGDGFGVRPYLTEAIEQIRLAAKISPPTTDAQLYADQILNTGNNNLAALDDAIEKTLQIFAADTVTEAQSFADSLEDLLNQVLNGADLDSNGAIDPTKNEGGIVMLYENSLLMGEIPIFAKK